MKKITKLFVLVIGILLSVTIANGQILTLTLPTITAKAGDTINVPIDVTLFNSVGAFGLQIDWDSTLLKYDTTSSKTFFNPKLTATYHGGPLGTPIAWGSGGHATIAWSSAGWGSVNIGNGTLCTLSFIYLGPTGCTPITWNAESTIGPLDGADYIPTFYDGSVCLLSDLPPEITTHPQPSYGCDNSLGAFFSVTANDALSYQWLVSTDGVSEYTPLTEALPYSNVNSSTLNIDPITFDMNGYFYECVVTNDDGSITSNSALLTVYPLPIVNVTPAGPVHIIPQLLTSDVSATVTYQWQFNGTPISDETNSTYNVINFGDYSVVVTDNNECVSESNTVIAIPSSPLVIDSIKTNNLEICAGSESILTVYPSGGSGSYLYTWSTDGIDGSISVFPETTTTYKVTVDDGITQEVDSITVIVNPLPTAAIFTSDPTTFCAGGSAELLSNVGDGYSYQWYINDVLIELATDPNFIATESGNYTVKVTSLGCSTLSEPTIIIVNLIPSSLITPEGSTSFCEGDSVLLVANAGEGYTYQWLLNEVVIEDATENMYNAKVAGSYSLQVLLGDCSKLSESVNVIVNAKPEAVITPAGSTTFCEGNSVELIANAGEGLTYQWWLNDVTIEGATDNTYNTMEAGTYLLQVFSNSGCFTISEPLTVTVLPVPLSVITPEGPTTFCEGDSVLLIANAGEGLTYQWFLNEVMIDGAIENMYNAKVAGSYSLQVLLGTCLKVSEPIIVTIGLPESVITPEGPTAFCDSASVNVNLMANEGAGLTYQWWFAGATIEGATDIVYNALKAGTYLLQVFRGNCFQISDPLTITVKVGAVATITPSGETTFCAPGSVDLIAFSADGYTYQWLIGGDPIIGATDRSFFVNTSGSFSVVETFNGCSATSEAVVVTVNPLPIVEVFPVGPRTIFEGDSLLLTATTDATSGIWRKNGVEIPGATDITYYAKEAGVYTAFVSNGTCTNVSNEVEITVEQQTFDITVTAEGSSICLGETSTLQAQPTPYNDGKYKWQWSPGGETTMSFNVTPDATTTYFVTVTDSISFVSVEGQVTVVVNNPPVAEIIPSGIVTPASAPQILVATAGEGYTYQWYTSGDGLLPIDGAINDTLNVFEDGEYVVVISHNNCRATSDVTTVVFDIVEPLQVDVFAEPQFLCSGESTLIQAGVIGGTSPYHYNWSPVDAGDTDFFEVTPEGTTTYYVTVTDDNENTAIGSVEVIVTNVPVADINANGPTIFCSGGSVTLNPTVSDIYSYQWRINGININGATNFTYLALQTGMYSVMLSLNDCSKLSGSIGVTVNNPPVAVINPSGTVNSPNPVVLSSFYTNPSYTYQWNKDGFLFAGPAPGLNQITVDATGNYVLIITSNGCSSGFSNFVQVNINPVVPDAIIYADHPGPAPTNLTATGGIEGSTYQWYKNGVPIDGATNSTYTATENGEYFVIITTGIVSRQSNTIYVGEPVGCPQVTNPEITTNQPNKVVFSWTGSADRYIVRVAKINPDDSYDFNYLYRVTASTSATFTNLEANTRYRWTVKAWCGSKPNNNGYIPNRFFTTNAEGGPCPRPTNLTHNNVMNNSAFLSWTNNAGPDATFKIRYYMVNNISNLKYRKTSGNSFPLIWLKQGTWYSWQVKALCAGNNAVPYSYQVDQFQTTGIAEPIRVSAPNTSNTDMMVYPNPSNGVFTLSVSGIENSVNLKITNIEGQEVYNQIITTSITQDIDLSNLAKGMYYVRLINTNDVLVKKIVIQ